MKKTKFIVIATVLIILAVILTSTLKNQNNKLSSEYIEAEKQEQLLNETNPYNGISEAYIGPNSEDNVSQGDPNFFLAPIE